MDNSVPEWVGGISATADRSPDFVCVQEAFGEVLYVNPAGMKLVGAQRQGDIRVDPEPAVSALAAGGTWSGDTEIQHLHTGEWIAVWVTAYVISGRHASAPVVVAEYRDLRQRNRREQRLRDAIEAVHAHALEQRAVADLSRMALTASSGEVLAAATQTAVSLMGMKCAVIFRPDVVGGWLRSVSYSGPSTPPHPIPLGHRSHADLALRADRPIVCDDRDAEVRFPTDFMIERELGSGVAVTIPGRSRPWGVLTVYGGSPHAFDDAELAFVQTIVGVLSAVIRRVELEGELRYRSLHDPLTGLANRVLAQSRIDVSLRNDRQQTAVLVVDLDNFKDINDTFGHAAGDRVLQTVSRMLAAVSSREDTVARFGGDEFVVVHVSGRPVDLAEAILEEMRHPIRVEGYEITVDASIGIAVDDLPGSTVEGVLRRADDAMYAAKRRRRPGYVIHDRSRETSGPGRRDIEDDFEFEQ